MANPFIQDMVRMQAPQGGGSCVAFGGFTLEADEDGCVTVPKSGVEALQAHGFTPFHEPAKKGKAE